MRELLSEPPEYVLYVETPFHPAGTDRLKQFPELQSFIKNHYKSAFELTPYVVYKRSRSAMDINVGHTKVPFSYQAYRNFLDLNLSHE